MDAGIYVHIPFCQAKCLYCSFNSQPLEPGLADRYCVALVREIGLWASGSAVPWKADTVYFGGGTPSALPAARIAQILAACREAVVMDGNAEVTLEANPGTLTADKLAAYRNAGVNRVSLGAQSFSDRDLASLGRLHRASDIHRSLQLLTLCGFDNVSLDLMLGLPGQTADGWQENLRELSSLGPGHASVYMLELEPCVPLYRALEEGEVSLPEEDEVADWYLETRNRLQDSGYRQYEISNFSRTGMQCRHNVKYWERVPVIGFGAGSHSFDGLRRYANEPDPLRYTQAVEAGRSPVCCSHALTEDEKLEETLFLGLRLTQGLDWSCVERDSASPNLRTCETILRGLAQRGLVEWDARRVRLTAEGMLLSNEVFQQIIHLSEHGL